MGVENVHRITRTLREVEVIAGHQPRTESAEFRANKARLVADGHGGCFAAFILGRTDECSEGPIQTHHYGEEWCEWNECNPEPLKAYLLLHDIYGYSKVLAQQDIASADDIRNLMNLCERHHITKGTGIHETTFPVWLAQLFARKGFEVVPREDVCDANL